MPPPTIADQFAARLHLRDNPPPPPPLSQEPLDVEARIAAWLRTTHAQRDQRSGQRQAQALLALMAHPELTTQQLRRQLHLGERATGRLAQVLLGYGLVTYSSRAGKRYHRLTRAAEDALLLVVQGPQ